MGQMKNPKARKSSTVGVRLTDAQLEAIDAYAKANDFNRSEAVRDIIRKVFSDKELLKGLLSQ